MFFVFLFFNKLSQYGWGKIDTGKKTIFCAAMLYQFKGTSYYQNYSSAQKVEFFLSKLTF